MKQTADPVGRAATRNQAKATSAEVTARLLDFPHEEREVAARVLLKSLEQPGRAPDKVRSAITERLARTLAAARSDVGVPQILTMIASTEEPGEVLQTVLRRSRPRDVTQMQAIADALIAVWNATPRPDLGGRTPEEVFRVQQRSSVQGSHSLERDLLCPCGSGRSYDNCCARSH